MAGLITIVSLFMFSILDRLSNPFCQVQMTRGKSLLELWATLSLFYKERSKIMYSHQFWVLYSRSLIWTLVFVQSFLISKSLNSRNFKVKKILLRYLLVNMFSRGNDFIYLFFLRLIPNWNNAISSHATFEDVNIHSKY